MEKDIIILKFSDLIRTIEESTGEEHIHEVEITPVLFTNDDIYMTGFKMDTPSPMVRLKVLRKLNLFNPKEPSQEELELLCAVIPDGDFWIDCEALDEYTLSMTLTQVTKKILNSTPKHVIYFEYIKDGKLIKRNVAYESKKLACKDILALKKKIPTLVWKFSDSFVKEQYKMTDLEFATAAL